MMRHYVQTKLKHSDHIVLYRVGDFFETFFEDAYALSAICNIALTSKDGGRAVGQRIPMAGVPHHALENKLKMILAAGRSVAVVDQLERASPSRTTVRRGVTRILTPGTLADASLLTPDISNCLMAIHADKDALGIAIADVSTGQFRATQLHDVEALLDSLAREKPAEVIAAASETRLNQIREAINGVPLAVRTAVPLQSAMSFLAASQGVHTTDSLGCWGRPMVVRAAALLLRYLDEVDPAVRLERLRTFNNGDAMVLDASCLRNMEVVETMRDGDRTRSLRAAVDRTVTAMGARTVRAWLLSPLLHLPSIRARHGAVQALLMDEQRRVAVRARLKHFVDMERLAGSVAAGRASPRDLRCLAESITRVPEVVCIVRECFERVDAETKSLLPNGFCPLLGPSKELLDLAVKIVNAIVDPAPISVVPELSIAGGGAAIAGAGWSKETHRIFRDGYDRQLDTLRQIATEPDSWIASLEAKEQQRSGINQLRVKHVKNIGYVLRIPRSVGERKLNEQPSAFAELGYERLQSTKAELRFRCKELISLEQAHNTALADVLRHELSLFNALCACLAKETANTRQIARSLAETDVLCGFATVAQEYNYTRPHMLDAAERIINIVGGRHAVVEQTLATGQTYVSNSFRLGRRRGGSDAHDGTADEIILCGPNAAGKSCAIRSVGLICMLAQAGSFVPAKTAELSITDRLLTRVGAVDDVGLGQSTFQVEMAETASILAHATRHSLVLLDEIGRGTGVADGIGIAWAVAQALATGHDNVPRTLFVTHYHELNELATIHDNISTYRMQVVLQNGQYPVATHRVIPGQSWDSFGIAVARNAGFPSHVIADAQRVTEVLRLPSRGLARALRQTFENDNGKRPQQDEYTKQLHDECTEDKQISDAVIDLNPLVAKRNQT